MIVSDSPTHRRLWFRELIVLIALTVLAAWAFRDGRLDFWVAKAFYHPENSNDPWFEQTRSLWEFFYHSAPVLTGILLLGSLSVQAWTLLSGAPEKWRGLRRDAILVFLVIALGPGLFVNAVFKPYWGRPRPREVIELGGKQNYQTFHAPQIGGPGKSFPCGHCSIGFSIGAFWWVLNRRRGRVTAGGLLALATSLAVGGLMGVGRIAAGGHFLSDVVWAGLMVYWVCYWVHYHLLALWGRRVSRFGERRGLVIGAYAGLGALTVVLLLVASPFHSEVHLVAQPSTGENRLSFEIDTARIDLVLDERLPATFEVIGYAKGFGFPGGKMRAHCERRDFTETCWLRRAGFFSDYESVIRVIVNPSLVPTLALKVHRGEVYRDSARSLPASYSIENLE